MATILADPGETPLAIPETMFVEAYKRHGAFLLRAFKVDLDVFAQLTSRYCSASVFNESGGRELLDGELNIQTVNLGPAAFPLHPELSRVPWKPDVCFFWCMQRPTVGGATTVCDGVEIVRQMPPPVRGAFAARRLRYTKVAPAAVAEYWLGKPSPTPDDLNAIPAECPFEFRFDPAGRLLQSFSRPALHKPMFCDELAFGNYLIFGRYLLGARFFPTFETGEVVPDELVAAVKVLSDGLTMDIAWTEGDIAVVDNTRFMHGRRAITDVNERRIATVFGYLKFAIPDPEEGRDPPWRKPGFRPPP